MAAEIIKAALIVIGNEILSGRTQDKNIAFLAQGLEQIGIRLDTVIIIRDEEEAIITTVNALRSRYHYVFTTGGIGPTHDDITSLAVAKAFRVPLRLNAEAERRLRAHYQNEINEARLKMAYIPEGASLIDNPISIAPGFQLENVYIMAGVPRIMQAMWDMIAPKLQGGALMHSYTISTYLAEGVIAKDLTAIQVRYPMIEIGSYPFMREKLGTSLVLRSTDNQAITNAQQELKKVITTLGGEIIEGQ